MGKAQRIIWESEMSEEKCGVLEWRVVTSGCQKSSLWRVTFKMWHWRLSWCELEEEAMCVCLGEKGGIFQVKVKACVEVWKRWWTSAINQKETVHWSTESEEGGWKIPLEKSQELGTQNLVGDLGFEFVLNINRKLLKSFTEIKTMIPIHVHHSFPAFPNPDSP